MMTMTGERPRYWYVVFYNCKLTGTPLSVRSVNITMVNDGGFWKQHFSHDVQGIFEMRLFYLCFYCLFFLLLAASKRKCKEQGMQFKVVKLQAAACGFTILEHCFGCLDNFVYAGASVCPLPATRPVPDRRQGQNTDGVSLSRLWSPAVRENDCRAC